MVEKGIREGMRHAIHRHAEANNKYMKDYDSNKESTYHFYLIKWKLIKLKNLHVILMKALKQALDDGSIWERVHRVMEFNREAWLKPYIGMNTDHRTKDKNDFKKDFFKLVHNSIFGKTMRMLGSTETSNLWKVIKEDINWFHELVLLRKWTSNWIV